MDQTFVELIKNLVVNPPENRKDAKKCIDELIEAESIPQAFL